MLDLCPRFIIKRFNAANKRYFAYSFTLMGVACAAYFYIISPWADHGWLAGFFTWLGQIRTIAHFGYRCPLCGGTRSFLYMFSGNINTALHHSFFGTFLFIYLYSSLPLRWAVAFGYEGSVGTMLMRFDSWVEKNILWLIFIGALSQLFLDYTGLFYWAA
ncbi:MAG: DUF2752 domain-containing protein [Candidatus Wallacebacter cryptica]|nr:DUF2752 domain-containing protein [Bacillota bacterium]